MICPFQTPHRMLTMPNSHSTEQRRDALGVENVSDHPISLTLIETTLGATGHYATRILTPVLQ